MRVPAPIRSLAIAAVVTAAGCGGPAAPDPYDQLATAIETTWSPIQVNIGISATGPGTTFALDPTNLALVVDTAGSRAAVHLSIPAEDLDLPPGALGLLGIDGNSIDFDLVYAGDALYVRSAILKSTLRMILAPTGKLPSGDLGGWLKLGTSQELAALSALGGSAAGLPSGAPPPADDPDAFRTSLESAGITITSAGTEKRNGADALHLKLAVDTAKLAADPSFVAGVGAGAGGQRDATIAMIKSFAVNGDLWIDPATNHIVEWRSHFAAIADATNAGDVAVTVGDPDGSVSLDAPSSFVDVPLGTLIAEMMKLLGKGAES